MYRLLSRDKKIDRYFSGKLDEKYIVGIRKSIMDDIKSNTPSDMFLNTENFA